MKNNKKIIKIKMKIKLNFNFKIKILELLKLKLLKLLLLFRIIIQENIKIYYVTIWKSSLCYWCCNIDVDKWQ